MHLEVDSRADAAFRAMEHCWSPRDPSSSGLGSFAVGRDHGAAGTGLGCARIHPAPAKPGKTVRPSLGVFLFPCLKGWIPLCSHSKQSNERFFHEESMVAF